MEHNCLHEAELGGMKVMCETLIEDMKETRKDVSHIRTILVGNGEKGFAGRLQDVEKNQTLKARYSVVIPAVVAGLVIGIKYLITGTI